MKSEIINRNRLNAILVKDEQAKLVLELVEKFVYLLIEFGLQREAALYFEKYFANENFAKIPESYEAAFKLYEDIQDHRSGIEFYDTVKADKKLVWTPKMVVSLLKMANKFQSNGLTIMNEQQVSIFTNPGIYSPFAVNIMLAYYGKYEEWEKLVELATKISDNKTVTNKFTNLTLQKQIGKCLDTNFKKKIIAAFEQINFSES